MGKSWENRGKIMGNSAINGGFNGKSHGKTIKMEVYWENPRTIAEWVSSAPG